MLRIQAFTDYLQDWGVFKTHLPLVPHICVSESGKHWFRQWLVAYSVPNHYPNKCWIIVNWTVSNQLRWNFNQNPNLFFHENASETIVCKMVAILARERWAKIPLDWELLNTLHVTHHVHIWHVYLRLIIGNMVEGLYDFYIFPQ